MTEQHSCSRCGERGLVLTGRVTQHTADNNRMQRYITLCHDCGSIVLDLLETNGCTRYETPVERFDIGAGPRGVQPPRTWNDARQQLRQSVERQLVERLVGPIGCRICGAMPVNPDSRCVSCQASDSA